MQSDGKMLIPLISKPNNIAIVESYSREIMSDATLIARYHHPFGGKMSCQKQPTRSAIR